MFSCFKSGMQVSIVCVKVVFYEVEEFPESGIRKEVCFRHCHDIMRNLKKFVYSKIYFSSLDSREVHQYLHLLFRIPYLTHVVCMETTIFFSDVATSFSDKHVTYLWRFVKITILNYEEVS